MYTLRLTAEEAREVSKQADKVKLLLDDLYLMIRGEARDGSYETMLYVDKYSMETVMQAMDQLREDGFKVRLSGHGWLFKRIKQFTKVHVKW